MKRTVLSLFAVTGFISVVEAQDVTIPDANFKAYLVGNSSINTNANAEISLTEAANFNGIMNCASLGITDLTGIEAFTGSFTLDCSGNQITTLDLSANTGLYNILQLDGNPLTLVTFPTTTNTLLLKCANTPLTTIDVSGMTGLTHIWAMQNNFTTLDLSANSTLIGMNLSQSGGSANPFTTIDLTGLVNLQWLVIDYSFLTDLNISPCTDLISLNVSNNDNLAELNMANGNNMSFAPGDFNATNCPDLTCVQVDNVMFSNAVWTSAVDAGVSFSLDCSSAAGVTNTTTTMFTIYPNPAISEITIQSEETIESIHIFDIFGNLLQTETTTTIIAIEALPAGVYFVSVKTRNGVAQQKFIKN